MFDIAVSDTGLILPPTPLLETPELARRAEIGRVFVKLESERPLGNFKVLGGMYAGLRLLAEHLGMDVATLVSRAEPIDGGPRLICASDGNHGLAVAAAAAAAGTAATIYLHRGVTADRVTRIRDLGASIEWIEGTYDDAVVAAAAAAGGERILVPDTSANLHCPAVRYVMQGYATMTRELTTQFAEGGSWPTHRFVQAGVGGLAAAVADGLRSTSAQPATTFVVEPDAAQCVGIALANGRIERVKGDLETSAEMLSCGQASAPALAILMEDGAQGIAVSESELGAAVSRFDGLGIATTSSGAAGLAGLLHVCDNPALRRTHSIDERSVALLIATEAAIPSHSSGM